MALQLPRLKKLSDIGGAVGNFFGGIGNAVGQTVDNVIPGDQSFLHNQQAAQQASQQVYNNVVKPVQNTVAQIPNLFSIPKPQVPAIQRSNAQQIGNQFQFGPQAVNTSVAPSFTQPANPAIGTAQAIAKPFLDWRQQNIDQTLGALKQPAVFTDPNTGKRTFNQDYLDSVANLAGNFVGAGEGKIAAKEVTPAAPERPVVALKSSVAQSSQPALDQFFADRAPRPVTQPPVNQVKGSLINKGTVGPDQATVNAINSYKRGLDSNIQLPAAAEGQSTQAILNQRAVRSLINERVKPAIEAANNLSPADHALLDATRSTPIETLVKQAENPAAFRDAAQKAKVYNDFTHGLGTNVGQVIPYRENYGAPLLYDLNDPATVAVLSEHQAKLATNPGYAKARQTQGYVSDLKRLNQNFAQDLATDAQRRGSDISTMALAKGLDQAFPGMLKVGEIPPGYTQLSVAGGKKLSLPDAIAKKINARSAAPEVTNPLVKGYDALNRGLKYSSLGGGTFHALTTAESVAGQQLTSGNLLAHPVQNLRLIGGTLSKTVHNANMAKFAGDGAGGLSTLDKARVSGVTLSPQEILGDANMNLLDKAKHSPLNFIQNVHDMVFARQIPEAKLMIFKQATKNLDPKAPADLLKMRQVASAVNNLGGVNRAVEGLSPATAQKTARFILATDFTETKFRKLADALTKGGPQGTIARQMIVGKVLVTALPGLLVASNAGLLKTPDDWAKEAAKQVFDPQFLTSFKSPKGYSKVAKLPSTEIAELSRVLLPLFQDKNDPLSGAKHYVTARASAGVSTLWSLFNNQDYFGNPVIAKNAQGQTDISKTAQNLALSKGPIPLQQGIKVATGQESLGEGITNTLGPRVVVNPDDPAYKTQQAYFKTRDDFVKGLNTNEQALFSKLNPASKDANGNSIKVTYPLTKASDFGDLVANPDFAAKYQAYQQSQAKHDPLWDLSSNQLRSYMQGQVISKNNPGGDPKTVAALYKNLPADFFAKRSQYFADLKAQGANLPDQTASQKPQMSPELTQFANNYQNLPYGTGARSAALRSPAGQAYIAYLDQSKVYTNQQRADLGLPPLPAQGQNSSSGGSRSSSRSRPLRPGGYVIDEAAAGKVSKKPRVRLSARKGSKGGGKVAISGKPRVSIKQSRV